MPKKRRSHTPPDTGRNQQLAPADFESQADWRYKKVTFSQLNDEFQRLKAKATKGKLNDPFERYLHDTYFPAKARRSKQPKAHTTSTARKDEAPACANRGPRVKGGKAAAATTNGQFVLGKLFDPSLYPGEPPLTRAILDLVALPV